MILSFELCSSLLAQRKDLEVLHLGFWGRQAVKTLPAILLAMFLLITLSSTRCSWEGKFYCICYQYKWFPIAFENAHVADKIEALATSRSTVSTSVLRANTSSRASWALYFEYIYLLKKTFLKTWFYVWVENPGVNNFFKS